MSDAPTQWWHLCVGTRRSWLPGDERGFRSRRHRLHSSGDYRNPPPPGEHAELRRSLADKDLRPVEIPRGLRPIVVEAVRDACGRRGFGLVAVAVDRLHMHALVRLAAAYGEAKRQAGRVKTGSSFALREALPGGLWVHGTAPKAIRDRGHFFNTFWYVAAGQGTGAASWADYEQWAKWYPDDPRLVEHLARLSAASAAASSTGALGTEASGSKD